MNLTHYVPSFFIVSDLPIHIRLGPGQEPGIRTSDCQCHWSLNSLKYEIKCSSHEIILLYFYDGFEKIKIKCMYHVYRKVHI